MFLPWRNFIKGISKVNLFQPSKPFKCQPHKTAKHTETICRLLPTNFLSLFNHYVRLALKGLTHFRPIFRLYLWWLPLRNGGISIWKSSYHWEKRFLFVLWGMPISGDSDNVNEKREGQFSLKQIYSNIFHKKYILRSHSRKIKFALLHY